MRHRLVASTAATAVDDVVRSLVALHSTDPASVFLAVAARAPSLGAAAIERALYDERGVVRMLGIRRTVWVVPREDVAVVHAAVTRTIAVRQRTLLLQHLERGGVTRDPERWLRDAERATLRELEARGEASATELTADVPALRAKLTIDGITGGVSTRVLFLLAADGRIVRGRPRGSWTSSQYRWSLAEAWLGSGMEEVPAQVAEAELARRWLRAFGPGTTNDLKWWTGWTVTQTRRALSAIDAVEVEVDGGTAYVLPDDLEPVALDEPAAALLPALDPTAMGWSGRAWYLGDHAPLLFDRTGNVGPTVWVDGRIVGGWAQRPDGEVVVRLLEDVGREAAAAVTAAAARTQAFIGAVRVTPRFRTPLERELSS